MALKTLVKVGNITNLSDARYCAGMGVELLGFVVVDGKQNFITPTTYQEIRGWVSGPSFVAEVYDWQTESIGLIFKNYAPDYLELSLKDLSKLPDNIEIPLILLINDDSPETLSTLNLWKNKVSYILVDMDICPEQSIKRLSNNYAVLLKGGRPLELLEKLSVKGVTLSGSVETKPGLKDYDHLSLVLEQLEETD